MVFSSITFIFYLLPLFLLLDNNLRLDKSCLWRNLVIILVSLLFYTWGEGKNVILLVVMAAINYGLGILIAKYRGQIILILGVCLNLLILFKYKYLYWLVSLLPVSFTPPLISQSLMPLGISFFTFHAISYLIDIYRKNIEPARGVIDFFAYFCMFAHLVAGPIVRYAQVEAQIKQRGPDWQLFNFGVYRFLIGLNKKILIANSVSVLADNAFAQGELGMIDAWVGIAAYTIQIYFDFSAYSDMAIGLAAMAGFKFEENFRRPYSAISVKDFWRRWHISLSSWFRDYVYIPLGGNRGGNLIAMRNLLIVFLLCGLWHGANFTFIVWGLWHGAFLVLERLKPVDDFFSKIPYLVKRVYLLLVVMLGWVFFKADSLAVSMNYLASMFSFNFSEITLSYYALGYKVLFVAIILCLIPDKFFAKIGSPTSHNPNQFNTLMFFGQIILAVISIAMLLTSSRNPFIYFNF